MSDTDLFVSNPAALINRAERAVIDGGVETGSLDFADYVVNELVSIAFAELPTLTSIPTEEESSQRVEQALTALLALTQSAEISQIYRATLAYYIFLTGSAFRVAPVIVLNSALLWLEVEDSSAAFAVLAQPEPEWLEFCDYLRETPLAEFDEFHEKVLSIQSERFSGVRFQGAFSRFEQATRSANVFAVERADRNDVPSETGGALRAQTEPSLGQVTRDEHHDGQAVRPNFCTQCGARLLEDAKFCVSCGSQIAR